MKIQKITIHNFRSIKDISFNLNNYSLIIGENNAGKSNIFSAIRILYENGGLKYDKNRDFPKFVTDDEESWIELEFLTTDDEQLNLEDDYKSQDNILKVRKYFISQDKDFSQKDQSNIYGYKNGTISKDLFYGAKNVSSAKIGELLYIPELSKADDNLKVSGPSPFRDTVQFILKKIVKKSAAYTSLVTEFTSFNTNIKTETTSDGFSLKDFMKDINGELTDYGINFNMDFIPLEPNDVIKSTMNHYIEDSELNNQKVDVSCLGQGAQRHLIYTLLKISSKYVETKSSKKKEFSPDLNIMLFEEPEVFLHPTQQENLNVNLKQLSESEDNQILITSHSPIFVSKNIEDLTSMIRVSKQSGITKTYQLSETDITDLNTQNTGLHQLFTDKFNDAATIQQYKNEIKNTCGGDPNGDINLKIKEECFKYFLWLDAERASLFFAKKVVICEGASEKKLFDYLIDNDWCDLKNKFVYFLDSMGKFNFHRFMNLLNKLGIEHSVIYDEDTNYIQGEVNKFIQANRNTFTTHIDFFRPDFEGYLGVVKPAGRRDDLKPIHIFNSFKDNTITAAKISQLKIKLAAIL